MPHQELNSFEKKVIKYILERDAPKYIAHLEHLSVSKRENTGVGVYVTLSYLSEPAFIIRESNTFGKGVFAEIAELEDGAGFMLYLDDGKLTLLEAFSHGNEDWPERISEFKLCNQTS